jgi:hypothetical protein
MMTHGTRHRSSHFYGLLLLLTLELLPAPRGFGQSPIPQPPQPAPQRSPSHRVAGRVVSATDGAPLAGATATLSDTRSGQQTAATVAGEDGRFAFENVPPGKYRLEGARRGYIPSSYQQHEQFFTTGIVTGTALGTESLVLRLAPAATLSGHITDESGEPVSDAAVTLYMENHQGGAARVVTNQSTQTDDVGSYELHPLDPGTYFLAVRATPWYAVHPMRAHAGDNVATAFDPALDAAYPLTFYANATSSDDALPIPVKGGEQLSIDMQLTPQPAIRLTLRTAPGEQQPRIPQLEVPVFDSFERIPADTQGNAAFSELVGLTPGHYRISEVDPRTGGNAATSVIDLARSTDVTGTLSAVGSGALTLQLQDAGGAKLPSPVLVNIYDQNGRNFGQVANGKGEVIFNSLEAGSYRFSIFDAGRLYYPVRVVADGKPLGDEIQVPAGAATVISVEIAASTGAVEGTVQSGDQPVGGAMVVLVPLGRGADGELFRRDQSDLDGSFTLANIVPGRYAVVAIDDGWTLDWSRREVLARYLAHSVPVTIPQEITGQQARPVRLPAAVPLQPR